jgi:hypothetical protein
MVAKYRVSLTELEITKLTQLCFEAKQYELYVMLNKQLGKISGGIRQPDYAAAGVRAAAVSNVIQTNNTAFTLQDDSYIPGTTIKGNATIREKFTLMGHTKLTWKEIATLMSEFMADTTVSERDTAFYTELWCHAIKMCAEHSNEQCLVFDLNLQQMSEDFITTYAVEIAKHRIAYILEGTNVPCMLDSTVAGSFMDYIPPVDSMSQQIDSNVVTPAVTNTVVDVLNKFGL